MVYPYPLDVYEEDREVVDFLSPSLDTGGHFSVLIGKGEKEKEIQIQETKV